MCGGKLGELTGLDDSFIYRGFKSFEEEVFDEFLGLGGVYDAVQDVGDAFGGAIEDVYEFQQDLFEDVLLKPVDWVVDGVEWANEEILEPAVSWAYEEVIKPVGDFTEGFVKGLADDPLGSLAKIAAIATGNVWMLPLISGAQTAINGGDFGDVLTTVATGYLTQGVGSYFGDVTGEFISGSGLGDAIGQGATDFIGTVVGQGVAGATTAVVYGEDPLDAFINGGLTAAVGAGLGFIAEKTGFNGKFNQPKTNANGDVIGTDGNVIQYPPPAGSSVKPAMELKPLPQAAQNMIGATISAELQGRDVTAAELNNALARGIVTTELVGGGLEKLGIPPTDDLALSYITRAAQRTAGLVLTDGLNEQTGQGAAEYAKSALDQYATDLFYQQNEDFIKNILPTIGGKLKGFFTSTEEAGNDFVGVQNEYNDAKEALLRDKYYLSVNALKDLQDPESAGDLQNVIQRYAEFMGEIDPIDSYKIESRRIPGTQQYEDVAVLDYDKFKAEEAAFVESIKEEYPNIASRWGSSADTTYAVPNSVSDLLLRATYQYEGEGTTRGINPANEDYVAKQGHGFIGDDGQIYDDESSAATNNGEGNYYRVDNSYQPAVSGKQSFNPVIASKAHAVSFWKDAVQDADVMAQLFALPPEFTSQEQVDAYNETKYNSLFGLGTTYFDSGEGSPTKTAFDEKLAEFNRTQEAYTTGQQDVSDAYQEYYTALDDLTVETNKIQDETNIGLINERLGLDIDLDTYREINNLDRTISVVNDIQFRGMQGKSFFSEEEAVTKRTTAIDAILGEGGYDQFDISPEELDKVISNRYGDGGMSAEDVDALLNDTSLRRGLVDEVNYTIVYDNYVNQGIIERGDALPVGIADGDDLSQIYDEADRILTGRKNDVAFREKELPYYAEGVTAANVANGEARVFRDENQNLYYGLTGINTSGIEGGGSYITYSPEFGAVLTVQSINEDGNLVRMVTDTDGNPLAPPEVQDVTVTGYRSIGDQFIADMLDEGNTDFAAQYAANNEYTGDQIQFVENLGKLIDDNVIGGDTSVQNFVGNALRATGGILSAFNGVVILAGVAPTGTALSNFANQLVDLGAETNTEDYKAQVEALKNNMSAELDLAEDASWAERAWARTKQVAGAAVDQPSTFLAEMIGVELLQEVAPLLVGGGATFAAKAAGFVAANATRAGLAAGAVTDLAESFGANATEAYQRAYDLQIELGSSPEAADAYAIDVGTKAGAVAGVATLATLPLGGLALDKVVLGKTNNVFLDAANEIATNRVLEGGRVLLGSGVSEAVEGGLPAYYVAKELYKLDPTIDVVDEVAFAATLEGLVGTGVSGGVYSGYLAAGGVGNTITDAGGLVGGVLQDTGDLFSNTMMKLDPELNKVLSEYESEYDAAFDNYQYGRGMSGYSGPIDFEFDPTPFTEDIQNRLTAIGIDDTYTQSNVLSVIDDNYLNTRDIVQAFGDTGYVPTQTDITSFVGFNAAVDDPDGPDLTTRILEYIDPLYYSPEEVLQAYKDAGLEAPRQGDIDRFVGNVSTIDAGGVGLGTQIVEYLPTAEANSTADIIVDEFGNKFNELGFKVDDFGVRIDDQGNRLDEFGYAIDEFGVRLTDLSSTINEQGERVNEQGEKVDEFGNRIDDLGNRIDEQGNVLSGFGTALDEQGLAINDLGTRIDDQGNLVDDLGNRIDAQGNRIDEFGNKLDAQGVAITDIGTELDAQGNRIDEFGNKLDAQGEAISDIDTKLDESVDTLNDTIVDTATDVTTQIATDNAARQQNNALRQAVRAGMRQGQVSVSSAPAKDLEYIYDFNSIFATPEQESLFAVNPFSPSQGGARQAQNPEDSIFGGMAQPLRFAAKRGGLVPSSTDKLLNILGK